MKNGLDDPWFLATIHNKTGLWPSPLRRQLRAGVFSVEPKRGSPGPRGIPVEKLRDHGIRPLCPSDSEWPSPWNTIPNAPMLVYARGKPLPSVPTLAVVGSRTLDSYASRITRSIVQEFSNRFPNGQLVSGGAMGVDADALCAALEEGLHTTVILAGGVDEPRPKTLRSLLSRCVQNGTLVSERYPGLGPSPRLFPERNRLISGLSDGLVVVRAALRSGSAHTIRHAIMQRRPILGVVGMIDDPRSEAIHELIQEDRIWPMWKPKNIHRFWSTKQS